MAAKAEEAEKAVKDLKARKAAAAALDKEVGSKSKSEDSDSKAKMTKKTVCLSVCGTVHARRAGVLAGVMCQADLSDLSWGELEKRIPKRTVHEKDKHRPPDPSDSEDDEEMASYLKLFKTLQDTSVVWPVE